MARQSGFVALFGEKYGDRVRTLQVGEFSKELCGGTHVRNTGNIGLFRIVAETAVAAGTRRIEAVTGTAALQLVRDERQHLGELAAMLKVAPAKVPARVAELADELKRTRKELEKALAPDFDHELGRLKEHVEVKDGVQTVVFERPGLATKDAQELLRRAEQELQPFAGVVLSVADDAVLVVVVVSKDLTGRVQAGSLVKELTGLMGGGGGGRPDQAQGKGRDVQKASAAAAAARDALQAAGWRP